MISIFDIGENLEDFFTGGKSSARNYSRDMKQASEAYGQSLKDIGAEYDKDVANAQALQKSAKQLYNEGKEQASAAASNKAGIAKRNAKAASMQQNGSKLMAAIQGAQSATNAATEGYDTAAQNAAAVGQAQNQAAINQAMNAANVKADLAKSAAQNKYDAAVSGAQLKAQNASEERNSRRQLLGQLGGAAIGAFLK